MANPSINQGTLNRLVASVVFSDHPELNVTASYLGEGAMSLALDGTQTTQIRTLTGTVTSPEPYQLATLTVNLLRTQPLADLFKTTAENSTLLGNFTARSDSTTESPYQIINGSIESVREQKWDGKDPGYVVTIQGYYAINSAIWP